MLLGVLLGAGLLVAGTASAAYDFSRYALILERAPFGETERDTAPAPPPGPVAPPFTKDIRMVGVTEDDLGVQVGFVDVAEKPPKAYLLRVGDTQDGFTLVEADYEREVARLRKGDEEQWISMSGAVPGDASAAPQASVAAGRRPAAASNVTAANSRRLSYAERLRQRRESIRVKPVRRPSLQGKELEDYLKEYQMELIRKGEPALPMPLTPEMDAQLVKEGVLPPME